MSEIINSAALGIGESISGIRDIQIGDTGSIDSFGRLRVSNPVVLFESRFLSNKNPALWDEKIEGAILTYSGLVGTFSIGQVFTGASSTYTGTITGTATGALTYNTKNNDFILGGTITSVTGSAVIVSVNTGATTEYQYNRASVYLKVGTLQGQKAIRQTFRYYPYIAGFSQLINTTQIFNAPKLGVKQTVIYGDELNGIGLVVDSLTTKVLLRSNTSGAPSDTLVPQVDWNLDNLNGKGPEYGNPSGILLDITKNQIFAINFQWLGLGRVKTSLNIGGKTIFIHEFLHANKTIGVYMRTPTLPIRYEIENTTNTASPSYLEQVCSSIMSEGGTMSSGIEFSASHGILERTLSSGVRTPILAIRLKNASENGGLPVRRTVKLVNIGTFARASDVYIELIHVHNVKTFTGTWTAKDDSSAIMVSKDVTAITSFHEHEVESEMVPVGVSTSSAGAGGIEINNLNNHIFISQNIECNNSQLFVLYATSRSGTAYASAHISWTEYE